MTEHGVESDAWPELFAKVEAADIVVLGTPIWLGERSSVCSRVIERMYAHSGQVNDAGGVPAYGNQSTLWEKGFRFDHPNPEYR